MARDIEEFLRRAAERRQQQKAQGQQPRPAQPPFEEIEVEIVEPQVIQPPRRRKDIVKPVVKKRQSISPNIRTESVAAHVQKHIDTSKIAQHAERLGDGIAGAHDRIDSAVHRRLDHDVGRIDNLPTVTDDPRPGVVGAKASPIAAELVRMLSTPHSIRQAILIREILDRPDWGDE